MAIRKRYVSPRQKMINLLYVVLMAMLALNVEPSGKVDGFPMKGDSISALVRDIIPERILEKKDMRVNKTEAFIIPDAMTVLKGGNFRARVLMAAVDSINKPQVFIEGEPAELENDYWTVPCNRTGSFTVNGELHTRNAGGEDIIKPFSCSYNVIEGTSTVANELTNMLYAGYDNPINISMGGFTSENISASMTGGSLRRLSDGRYIARPETGVKEAVITVTCRQNNRNFPAGKYTFRVRPLPDPAPYLMIGEQRYKGGSISKQALLAAGTVNAAIDDGILDIPFSVKSFEMVFFDNMGNAVPMASEGNRFSERQTETIRSLVANRRFYISRVNAIGPDGILRKLNTTMEVIVKR